MLKKIVTEIQSDSVLGRWREVLTSTPRFNQTQWNAAPLWLKWLVAARASLLVLTITAVIIAGLLCLLIGSFDLVLWLACLVGLVLAHASNNMLNDYIDYSRGLDQGNYYRARYGTHVLNDGLLDQKVFKVYIGLTGFTAFIIALGILIAVDGQVLIPTAIGALILLFYTYPMKTLGLGELAVLLVWGPLMVGGTFQVVAGYWSWPVAFVGAVTALGPTSLIFAKHVDKLMLDKSKGVKTLPVRMGEARSRRLIQVILVLMYVSVVLCVGYGWLPIGSLAVGAALPAAVTFNQILLSEKPEDCPALYPVTAWPLWFAAHAFIHTRRFGLLLMLGAASGLIV
jgi:1,4-dihydroxy-2-naphthoate octaprenyltransferase